MKHHHKYLHRHLRSHVVQTQNVRAAWKQLHTCMTLLHNNFTASPPNSNHKNNSAYNRPNAYKQKGCKILILYDNTICKALNKSSYSLYLFNQRVTFTLHLHTCNSAYTLFNSITYCFKVNKENHTPFSFYK